MSLKALQDYTFVSKYARYIPELKRRETWEEAVTRVKNMHLEKYSSFNVQEDIEWAFSRLKDKLVLGSQRALQFGGQPILRKNPRLYNCAATYCDRVRIFQETFFMLLCGTGTGISVQFHHVNKLPEIVPSNNIKKTYVVDDSIEGWSDALGVLVASYMYHVEFEDFLGCEVEFDYSKIRPEGSPLSSACGKAPGPEPLRIALEEIRKILNDCRSKRNRLRPIDAYDILMHASDAVLSGGVRRCIAKGQKVLIKDKGFANIEDIEIGDLVSTDDGWSKVTNKFIQGKQNTIIIKHQDGELECTANHRVAIMDSDNSFKWKKAKELNQGDRLLFVRNTTNGNITKLPEFNYTKPLHSTTCKDIVIPELDLEIAWFIGCFHGDGYVYLTSKLGYLSVAVEGSNYKQALLVKKCFERFGVHANIRQPRENDNCYKICVKSKQLAQYIYNNIKQPKKQINIPDFIKAGTPDIRAAYLQGILDSDGSIKTKPQQAVVSVYKDFVKQLQSLYYSLGICTRFRHLSKPINENWQDKYALHLINKYDKLKFNELSKVGFKKYNIGKISRCSNSFLCKWFDGKIKPKGSNKKINFSSTSVCFDTYCEFFKQEKYVPIEILSIKKGNYIETYDIEVENQHCFICEGVLVHNSATLIMFSPEDEDMIKAKTGDWFDTNPQRARSNNSAMLIKDQFPKDKFLEIMNSVKEFGEPGFIWCEDLESLFNPCVEINLRGYDSQGNSGWQTCNLCEINGSKLKTKEDFTEAAKAAAIIGTLQAGYTDFPYLGSVSEEIIRKEALLGVSITGVMDNPKIILNPEIQREMAQLVVQINKEMAAKIRINPSARTTCLKPAGSTSCLLGTSSGIHPHHAFRYFRNVQANKLEEPLQFYKKYNPKSVEKTVWSKNGTDETITFCIEVPPSAKTKNQMTAVELLEQVKLTKCNWIEYGKDVNLCVKPWLSHNVSNTITVKPDEWDDVANFIFENQKHLAGVSLIPDSGDKDYPQAPFIEVHTLEEIENKYGNIVPVANVLIELGLSFFEDLHKACNFYLYHSEENHDVLKTKWIDCLNEYHEKYFSNKSKKDVVYSLKDVYTWNRWCSLKDEYMEVDYVNLMELEDNTKLQQEIACSGGTCQLI